MVNSRDIFLGAYRIIILIILIITNTSLSSYTPTISNREAGLRTEIDRLKAEKEASKLQVNRLQEELAKKRIQPIQQPLTQPAVHPIAQTIVPPQPVSPTKLQAKTGSLLQEAGKVVAATAAGALIAKILQGKATKKDVNELQKDVDAMQSELSGTRIELSKAQNELSKAPTVEPGEIERLTAEIARLKKELAAKIKEIRDAEAQLKKLSEKLTTAVDEIESEFQRLDVKSLLSKAKKKTKANS